jgi:hypothetical protein
MSNHGNVVEVNLTKGTDKLVCNVIHTCGSTCSGLCHTNENQGCILIIFYRFLHNHHLCSNSLH